MHTTLYSHVNALLDELLPQVQAALGPKLTGVYLYGSLVTGDFDAEFSDIDLLAVIERELDPQEFSILEALHLALQTQYAEWENRIEIAYASRRALETFRTERTDIAVISPGEPFHMKDAGIDWLINWYIVREQGVTLYGPPPSEVIPAISKEEFFAAVRRQAHDWREWVNVTAGSRPYQSYAVITLCRALYAIRFGVQPSKRQAALWAIGELPEWSALIENALVWRAAYRDRDVDPTLTFDEVKRFVHFVIDRIG